MLVGSLWPFWWQIPKTRQCKCFHLFAKIDMMMIMMRPQIKDEHSQQTHFHHHQNHYETKKMIKITIRSPTNQKKSKINMRSQQTVNKQNNQQELVWNFKDLRLHLPRFGIYYVALCCPFWHLCCPVLPRFAICAALCYPVLPSVLPCVAPLGICVAQFWHQHHESPLTLSKICRWC